MKIQCWLIGFFSLTLFTGLAQTTDTSALAKFVMQKTDEAYAKSKVPGILVFYRNKNEKGLYTTGYANPDTKSLFDENTFFEIGSITKTFTAYVLLSVLRDHKMSDTTSIIRYLP